MRVRERVKRRECERRKGEKRERESDGKRKGKREEAWKKWMKHTHTHTHIRAHTHTHTALTLSWCMTREEPFWYKRTPYELVA